MKATLALLLFLTGVPLVAQPSTYEPTDYIATWHGNSNLFQSTLNFKWYAGLGGGIYYGMTYCPDGAVVHNGPNGLRNYIFFDPATLQITGLAYSEYSLDRDVDLNVYGPSTATLTELYHDTSTEIARESGFWTVTAVPEPCSFALILTAELVFFTLGRRSKFRQSGRTLSLAPRLH